MGQNFNRVYALAGLLFFIAGVALVFSSSASAANSPGSDREHVCEISD